MEPETPGPKNQGRDDEGNGRAGTDDGKFIYTFFST